MSACPPALVAALADLGPDVEIDLRRIGNRFQASVQAKPGPWGARVFRGHENAGQALWLAISAALERKGIEELL